MESALPALLGLRLPGARGIDWGYIERELGVRLPQDFMELSEFYSSVILDDFLSVHIPDPGKEHEFISVAREFLSDLQSLRESDMSHGYVPYPEDGGVIPWADSCDGDTWYWKTGHADPNRWPVVLSGHSDDWVEIGESLTGYLAGLVQGRILPEGLPSDFPGRRPGVESD
ncbi:hypothetical protein [Streptomyces sp. MUM 178J]|uniref:hypothetical protein n=1 Tax=Streptomyces sp. MUM 178J TaxID=2791991 RepID=UPI002E7B861D|nr:hypothetical protein [Streptomyces sp. MUM 178J]WRQ82077.1 hypothetical protein I3F59_023465 [Streptomyces sp. MUM 178J]